MNSDWMRCLHISQFEFISEHAANSREPGNTECSQALPGGGRTNDTFLQTVSSGKADCYICHLN